jgi:pyruvate/2-oxoglutarate dehydrogenase complex dihydrolipoamide dehydrogenase (E3) component
MEQACRSFIEQLHRSGVELRVGHEATSEELEALGPDAVIMATGSRPIIPEISGLKAPATAEEILTGTCEVGERVLVRGGGMVGIEVAEFLAGQGKQVVMVTMMEQVASDMDPVGRVLAMKRLHDLPVEIHVETELVRIEEDRTVIKDREGQRDLGRFDTVVVAVGNRSFDPMSETLRKKGITVLVAGDAATPARLYDAVSSGRAAALAI